MSTIVAGVDGSPGSLHALQFAAEEARLRGAVLRIVLAWEYPVSYYAAGGWPFTDDELQTDFRTVVERRLQEIVEAAAAETTGLEVVADALAGLGASRSAANLRRRGLEADIRWCARESVLDVAPRFLRRVGEAAEVALP